MEARVFKSAEIGYREHEQDEHRHDYAELFISLGGRTTEVVNGLESKTLPLDVFVLTSDVKHGQIRTDGYRYCIFKFDAEALIESVGEAALSHGFQSLFVIDPSLRREGGQGVNMCIDPLTAQYAEMTAEILAREGEGIVSDTLFSALALLVCEKAVRRGAGARDAVAEAVFFMNVKYAERITVADVAEMLGYSQRHLTRLFTKYRGVSPMKYLCELRLNRAATLLAEDALSVTEIAESVGFCDSSTFTKRFRERYGMTPTEYRRRSLGI